MFTSLRLVNFKNFADETLKLGPFTVIVGANASGKSNIRDAFRFLHGIGRGYTLAEIMGGKPATVGNRLGSYTWRTVEISRFEHFYPLNGPSFLYPSDLTLKTRGVHTRSRWDSTKMTRSDIACLKKTCWEVQTSYFKVLGITTDTSAI